MIHVLPRQPPPSPFTAILGFHERSVKLARHVQNGKRFDGAAIWRFALTVGFRSSVIAAELLPILLKLLDVLLQLGVVAGGQVRFDVLQIGLKFLMTLLLLTIVAAGRRAILARVALFLLGILGILPVGGTRRPRRRRTPGSGLLLAETLACRFCYSGLCPTGVRHRELVAVL